MSFLFIIFAVFIINERLIKLNAEAKLAWTRLRRIKRALKRNMSKK